MESPQDNPAKGTFVIIAEFEARPEHVDEFLAAAQQDARLAVAREPGCRQFDVNVPNDAPHKVVLYEVYDDATAFEAHLKTPHLAEFRAAADKMVAHRRVTKLTRKSG